MSQVPLILPQSITAIGTFDKFDNAYLRAAGGTPLDDYVAIDPARCAGFGDAPLRTTVYDAAGQDGALVYPPKDGGLILTLVGAIVITSTGLSNDAGYMDAVTGLYQELKAALDLLKTAPDDLVHSAGSMKVWKNGPLDPSFPDFHLMEVTFSVIQDVFAS